MSDGSPHSTPFSDVLGYEAAFYCLPDPVFIYNHSERRIILANDEAVTRYGYSEEQFSRLAPWHLEEPFTEAALLPRIEQLKDRGSAVYRTEHRTFSGELFPVEMHTIYRKCGGVDIFVAICRELTERLHSEARLEKAETHYQAIFENSVNLICVANLETASFIDVNPAFEQLLGYTREELINHPFADFIHPDDLERTHQLIERELKQGKRQSTFENRYRRKNGDYVWLDWSSRPLPEKNLVYGVACDITDRKWFEERLRQQNQRLRLHVDQTPLGVIEWGLDFTVTEWNPAAERIFGYTRQEAIGKRGSFILPEEGRDELGEFWSELVAQAGGKHSLNRNLHKDGSLLICEWHNTPLISSAGEVVGVASLVMDVSKSEQYKAELQLAKESAEKANQAKSEFLAMMSHELRTPLNSIVGPCELLRHQISDVSKIPLLDIMIASSTHLMNLINSILDLAKIESGGIEIEIENLDVSSFFAQRMLPLQASAEKKGLQYTLENEVRSGTALRTDARLLLQALFNVVGNAIKFTDKGSIRVKLAEDAKQLRIEIMDTGIGIPEAMQACLFEPFRQGPYSLSNTQKGSGLGLSITKRILENLGGSIDFESASPQGSKFTILLPELVEPNEDRAPSRSTCALSAGRFSSAFKILVVDDEPHNRLVIGALLKHLGPSYDFASTGEEAVELWKRHRYRIVLMDVRLPGIDGVQACGQIKDRAGKEPVYVIAQSAYALTEQKEGLLKSGMDDYISKPISLETLQATLARAFACMG